MVYGVTRIALPSCDPSSALRGNTADANNVATFVAGPENRLAVPALKRLLNEQSLNNDQFDTTPLFNLGLFNPLVLLGSSGTGKSHLARGITRRWQSLFASQSSQECEVVAYMTANDFARQLREAREEGTLAKFRQRMAGLRLLVLEDLHRLSTRLFVQRELRDTLDVLAESGAAVVITTQEPPATMAKIEAGLRDRLSASLTVRLQPPGVEARFDMLQQAANERDIKIDEEQLRQLAQKIEGPAPLLFRALAEHKLAEGKTSTLEEAQNPLQFRQLLAVVARYYSLTQAAIKSSARKKSLVQARAVTIYLARALTGLTYAQIGHSLGGRDHTTIMHASRTFEKRLLSDASAQQDIEELKRILTAV